MAKEMTTFRKMQPTFDFIAHNGHKKLEAERWAALFGFEIIDWDGFRACDIHAEIDLMTFVTKVTACTINPV
jgi:hypothetical protein